jgi:hypothetical protein
MLPTPRIVTLLFSITSSLAEATFSSILLVSGHSYLGGIFGRDHSTLKLRKPSKNLCCSRSLLSKSYNQHFKSSCGIFPHFKANFYAGPLCFQVCHFQRYIRIANGTAHSYVKGYYSTIARATTLLPAGNESADSIYSWQQTFELAAVVSSYRSRNHLITPCICQNTKREFFPNS